MSARLPFLLLLVLLLAALLGLARLTRQDPGQRNVEFFTEMAYSKAYESFSPNPAFADGATQQPLVAGVVPRGRPPFPYGSTPEEAARAGAELSDPLPADDPGPAALGAELYRIHCVACHDARGTGQGPVVLRGMLPPPSLHGDRALQLPDGQLFHVLTRGQGKMKSYAAQLAPDERWAVVRHVRRLQQEGP